MKTYLKLGLVGLALAASTAHADVALPSTGNGELTLFVRNDTTGEVYARGLQINIESVLSMATVNGAFTGDTATGAVQQINYSLSTIGPDANLSGFLNNTDSFSWTIMAGDNTSGTNDQRRYLTTTLVSYGTAAEGKTPSAVTNGNLGTNWNNLNTMLNTLNGVLAGSTVGDGTSTATNGQWRQTGAVPGSQMGNWSGQGPNTVVGLGTAAHLYVLTTVTGGTGARARVYEGFDVVLNLDGSLSAVAPPSVPLPPAVWMLMSGLVTLAGVGRRKNGTAA